MIPATGPGNQRQCDYHTATTIALSFSGVVMPFVYVLSGFGTIFLAGFVIHAVAAFSYWLWNTKALPGALLNRDWRRRKTFFGFLILLLLVSDSLYKHQPAQPLAAEWIYPGILGPLITAALWQVITLFYALRESFNSNQKLPVSRRLLVPFFDYINYARLTALLSLFFCILILVIRTFDNTSLFARKLTYAFIAYVLLLSLTLMAQLFDWFNSRPTMLGSLLVGIVGVAQSARLVTSSLVGLWVFLPLAFRSSPQALGYPAISALVFVFAAMAGFLLNDYADANKDWVNKPWRSRALQLGCPSRPSAQNVLYCRRLCPPHSSCPAGGDVRETILFPYTQHVPLRNWT
jgi:hypothetical protein